MTDQEKFEYCLGIATDLVSQYRAEAPEGEDFRASWVALGVAVVGTAVSAGTQMYSQNQAKKAAGKQSEALGNLQEFEPVMLGDPEQVDMRKLSLDAIDIPFDRLEYANRLSSSINRQNYREAIKYYRRIQPFFDALQKQTGSNALSFARGELPKDVQDQIQRTAAEKGIQGGFGFGSQGAQQGALANLNLRNLGLTSLDLSRFGTQMGMQVNQQARNLLPNLTSPTDFLFNPAQFLQAEQQNVQAQNQFLLRNNEIANQAAMQNTALGNSVTQSQAQLQYQQSLADAQQTAAIGSAIGSALSGSAGLFSGAGAGAGATGAGAGGMSVGSFMGRTNTQGLDLNNLY